MKIRINLLDAVVALLIISALVSTAYKAYLVFFSDGAEREYTLKIISAPQLDEGEVYDAGDGQRVGTLKIKENGEVAIISRVDKKIGEEWALYTLYSDIKGQVTGKK